MKYLCLICAEKVMEQMPEVDAAAHFREYAEFTDAIRESGHFVGCNRLLPPASATTLRVRDGKVAVTDGPFAETKELVGGFWLWQVRSREEAIEWARRCPRPAEGEFEIEIREVMEPGPFSRAPGAKHGATA